MYFNIVFLRKEHIFLTFFVCVSLPVFLGKTWTNPAPEQNSEPQKVYATDALTNAYIQCVENKMPGRKAAKLYNIPDTSLRDRLSGGVHIDTLLLHIETVLFSPTSVFYESWMLLHPIFKIMLGLNFEFLSGNSVTYVTH